MSAPVKVVSIDEPISEAARIICSYRISTLPVVDHNEILAGILTESDFLESIGIPAHHPSQTLLHTIESLFKDDPTFKSPAGKITDLMTKRVFTVNEDELVQNVVTQMKRHKLRHLVVCDDAKHVRGIISQSDLIRLFFDYTYVSSTNT